MDANHRLTGAGESTISSDTAYHHSGSASLNVAITSDTAHFAGADSDCITISPDTVYNVTAWYRTTTSGTVPEIGLSEYSDASCSQPDGNTEPSTGLAVSDGTWAQVSGSITTRPDAHSATFFVDVGCVAICANGTSMNFDDVSVTQAP